MFGLSFTELLVVLLVALIVIGPKDLPTVGKKLGRFWRALNAAKAEFESEFRAATRAIKPEGEALKKGVQGMIPSLSPLQEIATLTPLKSEPPQPLSPPSHD